MSIPPDFEEVPDDNYDLFYKIDPTGQVVLTGDKQRCVLSCTLSDGSRLQGGITESGTAFGTRTTPDGRTYDVRWQDVFQSARPLTRPQVTALDSPMFDPPGTNANKRGALSDLSEEMAALEEQRKQALRVFESVNKTGETKKEALQKSLQTVQKVISGDPVDETSNRRTGLTVEMLEEVSSTIESTIREVKRIQDENAKLRAEVEAENVALREQIDCIREESRARLEEVTEEYAKKIKSRRWLLQEATSEDFLVQGVEGKRWEIEDDEGNLQNLVVVTVSPGTTEQAARQWLDEVKETVKHSVERTVYVMARPGMKLSVLRLFPGVESSETEESPQF